MLFNKNDNCNTSEVAGKIDLLMSQDERIFLGLCKVIK